MAAPAQDRFAIAIYGTGKYHEWLRRYAYSRRQPFSSVIEVALSRLAEADGFDPPPRRVGEQGRRRPAAFG